ncbi:DUF3995 domain-containing protein [Zobellia russellii]|uniref:DUF3995 domain-containing protein n=1 Tax=Zobellia russellii TaxID=248907 RepID=UPI001BFFC939|nr:DUF3995 domain-containing protein [Zobellia russellii]MBT9187671.1 DUF3995 domain-containing protein [Zobellia russellii]
MVVMILSLILFLIFVVLGGFHFYWLFGGLWGLEKAIPTKDGLSSLAIPKIATFFVAVVLVLFGLLYLIKSGLLTIDGPNWIINYAYWFIPSLFILRAIGEFKYVGLFKKIKHTTFANADSKVFIPLCLAIGIMGILV